MISDSAALVLFAIRSSIKLGQQIRQAYVDATKRRELVLPLPNFFSQIDIVSAVNYFEVKGKEYIQSNARLGQLLLKRKTQALTGDEEAEVCACHIEFENLDRAKSGKFVATGDGPAFSAQDFNALITIRQWQRGTDPNPSTLQRIAGTLVEIGIDYFANVPGALNTNSREGKAVAGFLDAMSEIKFSEAPLGELAGRFFVATIETVSKESDLLSSDPKIQELVKVTTKSLSLDVSKRLEDAGDDLVKKERIEDWAELVFRSVLSSGGRLVLSDPKRYLGMEDGGKASLVSNVGESVLSLVLDNSKLQMDRVFTRSGLEKITQTALAVVGEHPEILGLSQNAGLEKLLSAIATELSQYDTLLTPDLLPKLTVTILDKTGENLALLWPDLANSPEKHLLLTAASTALEILARKPAAGEKWTLQFSSSDILVVAEAVFDELAANPTWLLEKAGTLNGNLEIALDSTLRVLRDHADSRLSTATAAEIMRLVISKVGLRKEFLDKVPATAQPIVAATLDAIFETIFDPQLDPKASWQLLRTETILILVDITLDKLAKIKLASSVLTVFTKFLEQQVEALGGGDVLDLIAYGKALELALGISKPKTKKKKP
jgi:hypothetical protein